MGIFSNSSSPFDQIVEKVTDEKSGEDWGLIMEVCDRVQAVETGPKDCLKSIYKRLNHQDPHVVLQAVVLLDACINNCGQYFLLEIASRDFETEYRKLLTKSHPKVQEKLKMSLKRWAEGEFSKDSKYSLIPTLYNALKREGYKFTEDDPPRVKQLPKDPNVVASKQEEDDIAKAIQLSLESSKSGSSSVGAAAGGSRGAVGGSVGATSLYPSSASISNTGTGGSSGVSTAPATQSDQKKARCLYDFEAAEDNELTFKAGEILVILDDQDANWWKGSNHRGEGLFPANFVTLDLAPATEKKKSVQFNEEVEVKTVEKEKFAPQLTVDEEKIDQLLHILHEADPLDEEDPPSLPALEQQVGVMGPMIDAELEKIDRQHAKLTRLSRELVESLQLYHTLMAEMPQMPPAMPPGFAYPGMPQPGFMPGQMMPPGMPMPTSMGGMMPTMPPGMVPTSMAGMPMTSMPQGGMPVGGMAATSASLPPGMMQPGMAQSVPDAGVNAPQAAGHNVQQPGGMPMYYMDPNMSGYMPAPQHGAFVGSAPPPTPPLYDPNLVGSPAPAYSTPQQ